MDAAVKVIDQGPREDFGFSHLLWVYSRPTRYPLLGVRQARQAAVQRGARGGRRVLLRVQGHRRLRPREARQRVQPAPPEPQARAQDAERVLEETCLPEQQLLEDDKYAEPVLAAIPVADVREDVAAAWKRAPQDDSVQKWDILESRVNKARKAAKGGPDKWALDKCVNEIIFAHVYPRLDVEVSKHMNHLFSALA